MLVREVGNGAASTVYYGVCRKSCLPVAIKVYNKQKLTRLNRRQVSAGVAIDQHPLVCSCAFITPLRLALPCPAQVEREINIHASLSHPHIIDFVSVELLVK